MIGWLWGAGFFGGRVVRPAGVLGLRAAEMLGFSGADSKYWMCHMCHPFVGFAGARAGLGRAFFMRCSHQECLIWQRVSLLLMLATCCPKAYFRIIERAK